MAEENETIEGGAGTDTLDLSTFVPEGFKSEEGEWDTAGFRSQYDDLLAFKEGADAAKAELPEGPEGYEPVLGEDFQLPEGFDPASLSHTDEEGNVIEFDPASMIATDDPDVAAVQSMLHEAGAPKGLMSKLMGVMVNREIRSVMKAQSDAAEQMKALGPDGKKRIETVSRTLSSRLPKPQADAVLDGITTADALRAVETLIRGKTGIAPPASDSVNLADMSIQERLEYGLKQRSKKAS